MTVYYKAIRPDGTDFYTGTVQWAPEKTKARKGRLVKHPTSTRAVAGELDARCETFLSVSTDPTQPPGAEWRIHPGPLRHPDRPLGQGHRPCPP